MRGRADGRMEVILLGITVLLGGLGGCSALGQQTPSALVDPPSLPSLPAPPFTSTSPLPALDAPPEPVASSPSHEAVPAGPEVAAAPAPQTADEATADAPAERGAEDEAEPYDPFATEISTSEDYDPWEPFNSRMFEFNRKLDRYLIKPVAQVYEAVVPDPVERGVQRVFLNLHFVPRFLNNLLQGKVKGAGIELSRFVINSTVGLAGFFDVAEKLGLVTPFEDTGQTLGVWGIKPGPYLVLPFFPQPLTVRDAFGYVGDIFMNPVYYFLFATIRVGQPAAVTHQTTASLATISITGAQLINERSIGLEKFQGVEEATLDLYSAVRNAYLQGREKAIRE